MDKLADIVERNEDWLMDRILHYALAQGYSAYTSTIVEPWRLSIQGLSTPMIAVLRQGNFALELHAEEDWEGDPVTAFSVMEGALHRQRGIDVGMFLAFMKYYRQAYLDLLDESDLTTAEIAWSTRFIHRFFDRIEIGLCREWISGPDMDHIQELQTTNRTIVNEKNKYLTIFESINEPVILLDDNGRIENVNKAASSLFDVTENRYYQTNRRLVPAGKQTAVARDGADQPFLGQAAAKMLPWLAADIDAFVAGDKLFWQGESQVVTADGPQYFEASLSRMHDYSQKFSGIVIILNNVTKHRQAEQAAQRARLEAEAANRAKSAFLANMSHELRTPLNAIIGFSQMMMNQTDLSSVHQDNLQVIVNSGHHLLSLINQVLDLSKVEAGKMALAPRPFDLWRLLTSVLELFRLQAQQKEMLLLYERDESLPHHLFGDEMKLRQALINLLGNSFKFTEKGEVLLSVSAGQPRPLPPNIANHEAIIWLRFEVKDTGVGIAAEELSHIFESFVQARSGSEAQEGTGLGLTITQKFVALMGGEIGVESEPGQGTTFWFELPFEVISGLPEISRSQKQQVLALKPGQPTYRILVVDDKPYNRLLVNRLLSPLGFDVYEAVDGREALAVWEECNPHLVFMDMRMPVMDGFEATRQIKSTMQGQATAVVAMTASVFADDRPAIEAVGCDGFLPKPFEQAEIFAALEEHLGLAFVYDGDADEADSTNPASELSQPVAGCLNQMPESWQTQFYDAVQLLDVAETRRLLSELPACDGDVAGRLRALVDNYRFDTLQGLLE